MDGQHDRNRACFGRRSRNLAYVPLHLTQRNLARLQRVLADSEHLERRDIKEWVERARMAVGSVYGDPSPQLERLDRVSYSVGVYFSGQDPSVHTQAEFGGVRDAAGILRALIEDVEEHVEQPESPPLAMREFHPWVADASTRLWQDGYPREAVKSASTAVETWLRSKLDVHTGAAVSIVGMAFSLSPATPDSPRLRFVDAGRVGSDDWKATHEGVGAFARGCMLRIRNIYTHNRGGGTHQEDLEALAALSLLARWIDDAELEKVGDT